MQNKNKRVIDSTIKKYIIISNRLNGFEDFMLSKYLLNTPNTSKIFYQKKMIFAICFRAFNVCLRIIYIII
mgnify:CR=1 FL=1